MPFVHVNNIRMYYKIRGAGHEPLVFISGLGADHRVWDALMPKFAEKYRCLLFDNRGVGRTEKPKARYSTKLLAQDVSALMAAIHVPRAHVMGISMGGAIAQELAINHPDQVGSLTLISTWAKADTFRRELGGCRLRAAKTCGRNAFWREHLLWCFTHDFYEQQSGKIDAAREFLAKTVQPAYALARQTEAVINHDTLDRLHRIQAPTLIVVGDEDISTPVRFATTLHDNIKDSKLTIVKGAGHSLSSEKPDLFIKIALGFLACHKLRPA
jgi:pimeloyl-ACP methyl ester carboxylesterase